MPLLRIVFASALLSAAASGSIFSSSWDDKDSPAASSAASPADGATGTSLQAEDLRAMRQALAAQQKELETLRETVRRQQSLLDKALNALEKAPAGGSHAPTAEVASLAPIVPSVSPSPVSGSEIPAPGRTTAAAANPCESDGGPTPPYLRVGATCIIPVGFMDLTGVWRNTATGAGIGSNFGSIPYNNTVAGGLSEYRMSAQNSRFGARVESQFKGAHVTGYIEADFLGFVPTNGAVSSNSDSLRLRLYWVDIRKGKWEMLAGQSWSLLTPNRYGLSPLPADIFFSQSVDTNYIAGLPFTRQAQVRAIYHPTSKLAMGVSVETPEQYIGGSGGGGAITLPSALSTSYATELNNGTTTITVPNMRPDVVAKIAYDSAILGGHALHVEAAGLSRTVAVYDQLTNQHFSKSGGGGSFNASFGLTKNLRLIANNFASDGGGRYLFGLAPDTIIRADGSPSLVHSYGSVDGFEANFFNTLTYAYFGGTYIGRDAAFDANGKTLIGYGFTGSSNGNNRDIEELTFGFNKTAWKNPRYGAFNYQGQYAWMFRAPWYVSPGAPRNAHLNMVEFSLRYTLPGDTPKF